MSSYQDVVKDMFRKHKGKASKDIMRMASAEWNKMKGSMSGRGLPADASLLTNGGKLKERKKRVPNVSAMGPLSEIPNFDSTGPSPYGEYVIKNQLKTLPASRVQVVKQLNFSGRAPTGRAGMGTSGGYMSSTDSKDLSKFMGIVGNDLLNGAMSGGGFGVSGGSFWDDFSSGFSSVFSTVAPFLGALL
jgi:hypothetical protein